MHSLRCKLKKISSWCVDFLIIQIGKFYYCNILFTILLIISERTLRCLWCCCVWKNS